MHEFDSGDDAADLDDEHHRILRLHPRIELLDRVYDCPARDRRIEERRAPTRTARPGDPAANSANPLGVIRYSNLRRLFAIYHLLPCLPHLPKTTCPPASAAARRWGRAPAPGRT